MEGTWCRLWILGTKSRRISPFIGSLAVRQQLQPGRAAAPSLASSAPASSPEFGVPKMLSLSGVNDTVYAPVLVYAVPGICVPGAVAVIPVLLLVARSLCSGRRQGTSEEGQRGTRWFTTSEPTPLSSIRDSLFARQRAW